MDIAILIPAAMAFARVSVACLGAGIASGCAEQPVDELPRLKATGDCVVQVIVGFARSPDAALVSGLERAHELRLERVDTITNELGVFELRVDGSDGACDEAIERLRGDTNVRSVDIDARRELQHL